MAVGGGPGGGRHPTAEDRRQDQRQSNTGMFPLPFYYKKQGLIKH